MWGMQRASQGPETHLAILPCALPGVQRCALILAPLRAAAPPAFLAPWCLVGCGALPAGLQPDWLGPAAGIRSSPFQGRRVLATETGRVNAQIPLDASDAGTVDNCFKPDDGQISGNPGTSSAEEREERRMEPLVRRLFGLLPLPSTSSGVTGTERLRKAGADASGGVSASGEGDTRCSCRARRRLLCRASRSRQLLQDL